jgi:hypothetical protein
MGVASFSGPDRLRPPRPRPILRAIKLVHTAVWFFFASCIGAQWYFALTGQYREAAAFSAIVALEVLILLVNRMRCPLTALAAKYTDVRADNFDIYLPNWLARYNKVIFGSLYACGVLLTLVRWKWPA